MGSQDQIAGAKRGLKAEIEFFMLDRPLQLFQTLQPFEASLGLFSALSGNVTVGVGRATGQARVRGVEIEGQRESDPAPPRSSDGEYLTDIFRQLDDVNRRKVIATAQKILGEQEKSNG